MEAGDGRNNALLKDDLELFNNPDRAAAHGSQSSDEDHGNLSHSAQSDDDDEMESDPGKNGKMQQPGTLLNPLALKPVFVSKIDREMLEPSLQLKEKLEKEREAKLLEQKLEE